MFTYESIHKLSIIDDYKENKKDFIFAFVMLSITFCLCFFTSFLLIFFLHANLELNIQRSNA